MNSFFSVGAGAPSDNACQANQQNMACKYGGTVTLLHHILWKERSTWEDNLEESGRLAWELLWSETLPGHGWILEEMLSVTTFSQASHLQRICFSNTQPFLEHSDKTSQRYLQRWNPTMAGKRCLLSSHFLGTQLTLASYIPTKGKAVIVLSTEHDDKRVEGEDRNLNNSPLPWKEVRSG